MTEMTEHWERLAQMDPRDQVLSTMDKSRVRDILATSDMPALRALDAPRGPDALGVWMVWMVHRVYLNDPDLTTLDLTNCFMLPPAECEHLSPKLAKALGSNTHLEKLILANANIMGAEVVEALAKSLRSPNSALKVLNLDSNQLQPSEVQKVVEALSYNRALEEFRCSGQNCEETADERRLVFAALQETMKTNRSIRKLGMHIPPFFHDTITRSIVRNNDTDRLQRLVDKQEAQDGAEMSR